MSLKSLLRAQSSIPFVAASLLTASSALAAPVVSSDTTSMGTHPTYGSGYSAIWRNGSDYSLLTDGTNTFVNSPSSSGNIYLRHANGSEMVVMPAKLFLTSASLQINTPPTTGGIQVFGSTGQSIYAGSTTGTAIHALANQAAGLAGFFENNAGGTGVSGFAVGAGYGVRGDNSNTTSGFAGVFFGRAWTSAGVWSGSDRRLKQDVKDMSYGLGQLMKLRPVTYRWLKKGSDKETQLGLIAQEVKEVVPEVVTDTAPGGMMAINYTELLPVVIKSIQEQQKMLREQQETIAKLTSRLAAAEHGGTKTTASLVPKDLKVGLALALLPVGLFVVRRKRNKNQSETNT